MRDRLKVVWKPQRSEGGSRNRLRNLREGAQKDTMTSRRDRAYRCVAVVGFRQRWKSCELSGGGALRILTFSGSATAARIELRSNLPVLLELAAMILQQVVAGGILGLFACSNAQLLPPARPKAIDCPVRIAAFN